MAEYFCNPEVAVSLSHTGSFKGLCFRCGGLLTSKVREGRCEKEHLSTLPVPLTLNVSHALGYN